MKNILPMWRMCQILDEKGVDWMLTRARSSAEEKYQALLDISPRPPEVEKVLTQATTFEIVFGSEHQGNVVAPENAVLHAYVMKYIRETDNPAVKVDEDTIYKSQIAAAKKIMQACKNHSPAFIQQERVEGGPGDMRTIYISLTGPGQSFSSDLFGLWKQYLEDLGRFWTLLLGLAPTILFILFLLAVWRITGHFPSISFDSGTG